MEVCTPEQVQSCGNRLQPDELNFIKRETHVVYPAATQPDPIRLDIIVTRLASCPGL